MFPLSDSIKSARFPFLTLLIILVTVFAFFQEVIAPDPQLFILQYALIPSQVHFTNIVTLIPFVTAIFLHGGLLHIVSNLWFLWVFGDDIEDTVSPLGYFFLYIVTGIVGNLVQYLLMPSSAIPILGASGAIAGVLGAYFVLFPYSKVKTLIFILFFITVVDIPAPIMLGYWFILQLFSGFGSLHSSLDLGGVAFWAHVGGFITGMILIKLLRASKKVVTGEILTHG